MEPIELSRWEPSPEDPRRKQYAGQRTAQEVFEELRHRLEGMGYLPDEYFLMNRDWENGREIPRGADIFCTTDYGGSEGIYLDVSLQWYENDRTVTRNFITGKTLGETGADLDRMFLISSAITKAFHGDRGTYARYLSCGEQPEPEAMIVHLDPAEQRTIIQALVEQRERQEQAMSQTEQLLRRMTGSITAYMEEVGQRPLRMSDYDKTVLAIQDGELTEFWARYPKALDQADSLLVETAGRPGAVGRRMTLSILSAATKISPSAYLTACKRAVDTGDGQRVQSLIEQAESCLSEPLPALTGVAILHAYTNGHRNMAKDLIAQCTSEQISSVWLRSGWTSRPQWSWWTRASSRGIMRQTFCTPSRASIRNGWRRSCWSTGCRWRRTTTPLCMSASITRRPALQSSCWIGGWIWSSTRHGRRSREKTRDMRRQWRS